MYPVIAIVGPTASGKSELALYLAEQFGGEIVNYDSVQIFRHLDIGTAKPSPAERQRVPHHMIDLREPTEVFKAGDYQREGGFAAPGGAAGAAADRGRDPFRRVESAAGRAVPEDRRSRPPDDRC